MGSFLLFIVFATSITLLLSAARVHAAADSIRVAIG